MPQGPIAVSGVTEGTATKMNIGGTVVVKSTGGRIVRVLVSNPGTSGNLVINDSATIAGAAAANQIISIPWNATNMYAGAVIMLDVPCVNGIVFSTVPGGSPLFSVTYY